MLGNNLEFRGSISRTFHYFQLMITSGVGAALDLLAHAIGDPGGKLRNSNFFSIGFFLLLTHDHTTIVHIRNSLFSNCHADCVLSPSPYYTRIKTDLAERSALKTLNVETEEIDEQGRVTFKLTVDKIQRAYEEAVKQVRY